MRSIGENVRHFLRLFVLPFYDNFKPDLESDRVEPDAFDHAAPAKKVTRRDVFDARQRTRERNRNRRRDAPSERPVRYAAPANVSAADCKVALSALDAADEFGNDCRIVAEVSVHNADDRRVAGSPAVDDGRRKSEFAG